MRYPALLLPLLMSSLAVLAGEAEEQTADVAKAEGQILAACKAESGTDPLKCDCYVGRLKSLLPVDSYRPAVILAAIGMSGDFIRMQDFIRAEGMDEAHFTSMMMDMEKALETAEAECGA